MFLKTWTFGDPPPPEYQDMGYKNQAFGPKKIWTVLDFRYVLSCRGNMGGHYVDQVVVHDDRGVRNLKYTRAQI